MNRVTIQIDLSPASVTRALRDVEAYKRQLLDRTELLRERVAKRLAEQADSGFRRAVIDDLLQGGGRNAQVHVSVEDRKGVSVVIASGEDAVWAEFGAGVFHNGSAGASPHPKGADLGLTIGSYGKGNGSREVWGFYDESGELRLTRGTQAVMPMYNAMKTVCAEIAEIAAGVFR